MLRLLILFTLTVVSIPFNTFSYTPVTVPNGTKLSYKMIDGIKEFHLIAETVRKEMAPGFFVDGWGYNGSTPGPVIEVVEGDRVRILVTNKLPEPTTVHWHGILLPSGMDGVTGLNQAPILPGETYVYEFILKQHGTYMYHPHYDEMTEIALGMEGMFIIHPKVPEFPKVDRDFVIMLHEWYIPPGGSKPDPSVMLDFNYFTFNSTIYPSTEALVIREGQRVRIRFGNLSMNSHPIHLHGYTFEVTAKGAGPIPLSARYPVVTVNVPVGTTRDIEFVANNPGDWAMHCHKTHHNMSGMGHDIPNMIGVRQGSVAKEVRKIIPGYMAMGEKGMGEMFSEHHNQMPRPKNFPRFGAPGPFDTIEMSGMFTVVKVRKKIENYEDPGWYDNPPGTVSHRIESE